MSDIQSNEYEQESSFGEQAEQTSDQGGGREQGLADDSPAQTPGEFGHDPQTHETSYGEQSEQSEQSGQSGQESFGEQQSAGEAQYGQQQAGGESSFGEEQQAGYGEEAPEVQAGEQGSTYDQGQEAGVPQQADGQQY